PVPVIERMIDAHIPGMGVIRNGVLELIVRSAGPTPRLALHGQRARDVRIRKQRDQLGGGWIDAVCGNLRSVDARPLPRNRRTTQRRRRQLNKITLLHQRSGNSRELSGSGPAGKELEISEEK